MILRRLIRQQLQNRLSPYIIFLIRRGQQPAIMLKILPMNELLHSDLPEVHGLNTAVPPSHKGRGAKLFRGFLQNDIRVRLHRGFPSGRLTSSNVPTWVLSNQDSKIAPQTLQDA